MDGRTVGTDWYGTWYGFLVRNFIWYGTWYGIRSGIFIGTVRGTDFGPDFFGTVRGPEFGTKIRSGTDNPDRYGFWYGFQKY